MTQFSSKPPFRKKHWENDRTYMFVDRPQHNPTNPILAKLRGLGKPHRASWVSGFLDQATHVRFPNWTDEQVDHAVRVLSRRVK